MEARQTDRVATLLSRVAGGDRRAFDALYEATSARLLAVCVAVLTDREDAEEALQEVYVKLWRHADRYDAGLGTPDAWLVSIARNAAVDRRRRSARRQRQDAETVPPAVGSVPTPEQAVLADSEARRLHECLSRLPHDRATAIRHAYFTGETYAEMAVTTGHPEGTLKSWVHRSLKALRDCLVEGGVEEPVTPIGEGGRA